MGCHSTVFGQVLKLVPRYDFNNLAADHHLGRKLRSMMRWNQFVALSLGQLAGRHSLRDIEANLAAQEGRLYHLGAAKVARSSLARVKTRPSPTPSTRHCSPSSISAAPGSRPATASASLKTPFARLRYPIALV